jgi:hypothetical protein
MARRDDTLPANDEDAERNPRGQFARRSGILVWLIALAVTLPQAGDLGLTWDEPAYRYSQTVSGQWWSQLIRARSWSELDAVLSPDALVYYWPYGRNGPNLHPPFAGQISLVSYHALGRWMKDVPSRRAASVFEYCLTITILYRFLTRRYGPWVGGVAAGSLLFMPRVHGDALIAATDMPGMMLWAAIAVTFWNALTDDHRARWRIMLGLLVGLTFLEKMSAVAVILPLALWLMIGHLRRTIRRGGGFADWIDGLVSLGAIAAPLVMAAIELRRLIGLLPPPARTDLFVHRPAASWTGVILLCPAVVWGARRLLARIWRGHPTWGTERPALEAVAAVLGIAPTVIWIGNPLWWRETLPRLAHYLMLNTGRRGVLPDIPIYYQGQTYLYTLPWHNAWVLTAITVPVAILLAAAVGVGYSFWVARLDRLPVYFFLHMITLPVVRMFGVPAHDGVRLFLPTFFFLAAMAGWGSAWVAEGLGRLWKGVPINAFRSGLAAILLGTAAWQLARIHPYELSYYNEWMGGSARAWRAGYELSYWYDAFNAPVITELNARLPEGANVDFFNPMATPETFTELQALGQWRADIRIGPRETPAIPFVWHLTQGSTATAFTRLLYAMRPWYESRPTQVGGLRIASVAEPASVSRALALQLLTDAPSGGEEPGFAAPAWIMARAPSLAWCWGVGVPRSGRLNVDERIFSWARREPDGLRDAARSIVARREPITREMARLLAIFKRHDAFDPPDQPTSARLLRERPRALLEAVEIIITRSAAVRTILTHQAYLEHDEIGGFIDDKIR